MWMEILLLTIGNAMMECTMNRDTLALVHLEDMDLTVLNHQKNSIFLIV